MTTPPKTAPGRARHGVDPALHHLGHVYRRDIRNGERLISRRYGIRMTEFVVLHMLALNGAMTLRDIADERFLLREDVFLAAGSLLERSLIRFVDRNDFFGSAEVTPEGRALAFRLAPHVHDRQSAILARLPKRDRTRLVNLLATLERALEEEGATLDAAALEIERLADVLDGDLAA